LTAANQYSNFISFEFIYSIICLDNKIFLNKLRQFSRKKNIAVVYLYSKGLLQAINKYIYLYPCYLKNIFIT